MKTPRKILTFLTLIFLLGVFIIQLQQINITQAQTVIDAINPDVNYTIDTNFGKASDQGATVGWTYRAGASHNICEVWLYLKKIGTPTDQVVLNIAPYKINPNFDYQAPNTYTSYPDQINAVNSPIIQADAQTISSTSYTLRDFVINTCYTVVGGNWYLIWLSRTGSLDSTNYYALQTNSYNSTLANFQTGTAKFYNNFDFGGSYNMIVGSPSDSGVGGVGVIVINGTENFSAYQPPNSTSTIDSIVSGCSGSNWLTNDICYIFQYLFVPSADILGEFTDFPDYLNTKIPFSYVQDIKDELNSATTSTSSIPTITFQTNSTSPLQINVDLFSASTTDSSFMHNFIVTMRALGVLTVWAFGAYVAYKMIINLIKRI